MQEYRVPGKDCLLYCKVQGRGRPLLLLHGVACDSSFFEKTAKLLETDFTVISWDRRGYGRSKAAETADYSVRAQAEDALRILDELQITSVCAAGCSAGGIIALEAARQRPERFEKLFLHEPPLGAGLEWERIAAKWKEDLRGVNSIAKAMLYFARMIGGPDPEGEKIDFERLAANMENLQVFLQEEMEDFLTYHMRLPRPLGLPVPCLLAAGSQDQEGLFSLFSGETARQFGFAYLRVPGYHNLAQEQPLVFAQLLKEQVFFTGQCE